MKAIKFDGELTDGTVSKLLEDIDKYSKEEEIIIYFCTNGGGVTNGKILSDYLNRNNYERFTIVVDWECSSAAFDVLIDTKCKIEINDSAFSLVHMSNNELNYTQLVNKNSISYFLKSKLEIDNAKSLKEFILAGFTNEEINLYKEGKEVILSSDRMKSFIKCIKGLRNNESN